MQKIIGIVERLRSRSDSTELVEVSNRLTVNVIRNQQRNRRTLDETNPDLAGLHLKQWDYELRTLSV